MPYKSVKKAYIAADARILGLNMYKIQAHHLFNMAASTLQDFCEQASHYLNLYYLTIPSFVFPRKNVQPAFWAYS